MAELEEISRNRSISRRDFARGTAITASVLAVFPAEVVAQTETRPSAPGSQTEKAPEKPQAPKLSPDSQAEAEAKVQNILRKYGSRLSDAEKAEVRKSVLSGQESTEKLRAYPLENWDEPAAVLRAAVEEAE